MPAMTFGSAAAFPGSSAAAQAAEHACSRHPTIVGPRFCTDCGGPLCTACARYRPHRSCPSCSVAAGKKAITPDVGWYAMLTIDGFVHAWPTVRTRILPMAVGSTLLGGIGVLGLVLFVDGWARVAQDGALAAALMGAGALGALALCVLAQPGLELPTTAKVSPMRRMLRAVIGAALPFLVMSGLSGLGVGLLVLAESVNSPVAVAVAVLAVGVIIVPVTLLSSTLLPMQAAYAVSRRSLFGALKAPFEGGVLPIVMMTTLWIALGSMLYSSLYAGVLPIMVLAILSPWAAAVAAVAFSVVWVTVLLVLTAAYATGSLRIAEDRARRE